MKETDKKLVIAPLTLENWGDFEILFGARGACGGCWCMSWRLPKKEFEQNKGDGNRILMKKMVEEVKIPGLVAYLDGRPVGWCSLGPREDFPVLERSRIFAKVDDLPVWSVNCFFVAKQHRGKGILRDLINAAVKFARAQGAEILESYPFDYREKKLPDPFVWTGICKTFEEAGFHEAARRSEKRPVMRYDLTKN